MLHIKTITMAMMFIIKILIAFILINLIIFVFKIIQIVTIELINILLIRRNGWSYSISTHATVHLTNTCFNPFRRIRII